MRDAPLDLPRLPWLAPAGGLTWPLIGVLHVPALPGSPRSSLTLREVTEFVLADARALIAAGFDALILENFGDSPFFPDAVEPHTIAHLALLGHRVQAEARRLRPSDPAILGINVLRNDAHAALGISAAIEADFVRVNVHVGAMITDQGILQGQAHRTLRYRAALGARAAIFADVLVKHASPLGALSLEDAARDTVLRGLADALIISGSGTGAATDLGQAERIRRILPRVPIFIGSGLSLEQLEAAIPLTSGAIVGTALKRNGDVSAPVDVHRARAMVGERRRILERRV